VRDFRELDVWRKAHQFVLDVYRATDSLPKIEIFGITVQLRRAAISIPTRIAEGCGRDGVLNSPSVCTKQGPQLPNSSTFFSFAETWDTCLNWRTISSAEILWKFEK